MLKANNRNLDHQQQLTAQVKKEELAKKWRGIAMEVGRQPMVGVKEVDGQEGHMQQMAQSQN